MSIEVKIGVSQHPHELDFEMEGTPDELISLVDEAVGAEKPMIWVTDSKGNRVGVPSAKIAFVEVRSVDDVKRVGFGV
ncbi:MAG TPA: DUF3107 domain-containing protein [Acidimicrobiia bacterium]|nr:DUF3107 domain-containing protein [Acidimicrobiia bacterium]